MKRRWYLTGLLFALISFHADVPAFQLKKQAKSSDGKALMGVWEAVEEGETVRLIFKTNTVLEFDGEESAYTLVSGGIRVNDPYEGKIDYAYSLKGDILVITFPEGEKLEFRRIKKASASTTAAHNERVPTQAAR